MVSQVAHGQRLQPGAGRRVQLLREVGDHLVVQAQEPFGDGDAHAAGEEGLGQGVDVDPLVRAPEMGADLLIVLPDDHAVDRKTVLLNRFRKALELHFAFPPGKNSIKIIDQFPKTYKRPRPGAGNGFSLTKRPLDEYNETVYGSPPLTDTGSAAEHRGEPFPWKKSLLT